MRAVDVVVPAGVDDPGRPSGGNAYDRRACDGLRALGWAVREWPVAADRSGGGHAAPDAVTGILGGMPDHALVLLDGLVACALPEALEPESARLRQVALVHLPLGVGAGPLDPRFRSEARALRAARAVIVPSRWTRDWLLAAYGLPGARVLVVPPGVDRADRTAASTHGGRLLCVGALTPVKGQDQLVEALAALTDLDWSCTFVGPTGADPEFARGVRDRARAAGLGARVCFTGPLTGSALADRFARADLLVVASRAETYGMVVTEAVARGIPVVAPAVGGLPEALGGLPAGPRPGVLVPPGDVAALAAALRAWLTDEVLRARLRRSASRLRPHLAGWSRTAASVAAVLEGVVA